MKQVQRDHAAMGMGGFSQRTIGLGERAHTPRLSVRIWTMSLQWPCASPGGIEGLIKYSTVQGQGAEKYSASGKPLGRVTPGLQWTELRE